MPALHTIAELTDDRVLYRDLEPVDRSLPGLRSLAADLGLPPGFLPRKRDDGYARVVLAIACAAQQQRGERVGLLLVVGDTENDRRMGAGLEKVSGVPTLTFIGCDKPALPPTLEWQGGLAVGTRWSLLDAFLEEALARHGAVPQRQAVVVADIDKTLLGPRGRSDGGIDAARVEAAEWTAAELLPSLDRHWFRTVYRELCQGSFHPFTEDNQDFVAYTALLVSSGIIDLAVLCGQIGDGLRFATLVEELAGQLPEPLIATNSAITAALQAGDPTPFKAFRHQEFAATVGRMASGELPLCGEVFAALARLRAAGALCMAASDKPAEASLPTAQQLAAGLLPLHRTPAAIG